MSMWLGGALRQCKTPSFYYNLGLAWLGLALHDSKDGKGVYYLKKGVYYLKKHMYTAKSADTLSAFTDFRECTDEWYD